MSSFYCNHCGAVCLDSRHGYFTGCEHYPVDLGAVQWWQEEANRVGLAVDKALKELREARKVDPKSLHEPLDASRRKWEDVP